MQQQELFTVPVFFKQRTKYQSTSPNNTKKDESDIGRSHHTSGDVSLEPVA